mmetsp:Transcript_48196/g.104503  ORF Transcript_48196/g.104503 Transcript_48196/m.104503 type:complete len:164 (-) Transcript_48196:16-507(-)
MKHTQPHPTAADATSGTCPVQPMRMGFPSSKNFTQPTMCSCHLEPRTHGHHCPRCSAIVCELPCSCPICELKLVASSHLARSFHHLFPIAPFTHRTLPPAPSEAPSRRYRCSGCFVPLSEAWQCHRCSSIYCDECDSFIHDSLHVCVGCTSHASQPQAQAGPG